VPSINLSHQAFAHWLLGYPEVALAVVDHAHKEVPDFGQSVTLMFALAVTSDTLILCGTYDAVDAHIDKLLLLANEKGAPLRKAEGRNLKGSLLASIGKSPDAIHDHLRDHSMAINRSNTLDSVSPVIFGENLFGNRSIW
jgi:hypothetical protein